MIYKSLVSCRLSQTHYKILVIDSKLTGTSISALLRDIIDKHYERERNAEKSESHLKKDKTLKTNKKDSKKAII